MVVGFIANFFDLPTVLCRTQRKVFETEGVSNNVIACPDYWVSPFSPCAESSLTNVLLNTLRRGYGERIVIATKVPYSSLPLINLRKKWPICLEME